MLGNQRIEGTSDGFFSVISCNNDSYRFHFGCKLIYLTDDRVSINTTSFWVNPLRENFFIVVTFDTIDPLFVLVEQH